LCIFVYKNRNFFGGANCLSLHRGALNEDDPYLRSVVLQQWLFGYELPDTIFLLKEDGKIYVCATKNKCEFLRPAVGKHDDFEMHLLLRNKEDGNAENYDLLWKQAVGDDNKEAPKLGLLAKERTVNKENGGILGPWEEKLDEGAQEKSIELVDINPGLSFVMGPKDEEELDLMKKSSVLSNKVMKHGCVKRLEEIIEEESKITHEQLATELEAVLEDPSKIKLNVPTQDVQSCYFPAVQSGGVYDLRVSAQSTSETLKHDIITVSLGARYKLYCSNISRTFLVDPPKKVSETYEILLEMQEACLEAMRPGNQLKSVYKAAVAYLQKNGHEALIPKLPKNFGFSQGLDFRDATLTLNAKNNLHFKQGMVFNLSVGFLGVELTEKDRENTPSNSAVSTCNVSLLRAPCNDAPYLDNNRKFSNRIAHFAVCVLPLFILRTCRLKR
jgi:nucleosome binding factor SPN SPT16 subunit